MPGRFVDLWQPRRASRVPSPAVGQRPENPSRIVPDAWGESFQWRRIPVLEPNGPGARGSWAAWSSATFPAESYANWTFGHILRYCSANLLIGMRTPGGWSQTGSQGLREKGKRHGLHPLRSPKCFWGRARRRCVAPPLPVESSIPNSCLGAGSAGRLSYFAHSPAEGQLCLKVGLVGR